MRQYRTNSRQGIANGIFFNLGARLARYTNNHTYAEVAESTWDWVVSVGLMDKSYNIFDGAHVETNCTDINRAQFSYNNGVFLLGAAYMYNFVSHYMACQGSEVLHAYPRPVTRNGNSVPTT
jgi:mannan endo-1,6-alpha-mannosidase